MTQHRSGPRAAWRAVKGGVRIFGFLVLLDVSLFALFDLLPAAEIGRLGVFAVDPELLASARERMGTGGPWHERLIDHWTNLLHGSMGRSLAGNYPIAEVFGRRLLRSGPLWAGTIALLPCSVVLAMPFATRRPHLGHRLARWLGQLTGVPQFLTAVMLFVAWLVLVDSFMPAAAAPLKWLAAVLSCFMLPGGVLFVAAANTFQRCAAERYCDTYLAIGMSWGAIRLRLLRNTIIALRPLAARLVLWTITGSVVTEAVFGIIGFGQLLVEAVRASDLNVVRMWMLVVGGIVFAATEVERR